MNTGYTLEQPFALTCPECGGSLRSEHVGTLLQYRCHIGHVLSAESMLTATQRRLEEELSACLAHLNERAELCRQCAENSGTDGRYRAALEAAAAQALRRAELIREMLQSEWARPAHADEENTA
jgi:two-component system, chemotaxis family, protein-glutamate methylesterase/glutaminase